MRGYRVGIINPRTPFGERVRELLSEHRLPVIELKLLESEIGDEATLTQFHDEVVVTQPLDADLLPHLDVVFIAAEDNDVMNRIAREAAENDTLTIVEGARGLDAPVVVPGIGSDDLAGSRLLVIPRAASYLVGAVLERMTSSLDVVRASATVLLPAGHRGAPGADELHQQVVNLLNFKAPPMEVFDEQLAFNVNVAAAGPGGPGLAESVAGEASSLAELGSSLTVTLLQVPVFHAYAASIWVELGKPVERRSVVAAFREAPFTIDTARRPKSPSPVSVAESNRIHVGSIRCPQEISQPGCWVWAVADTTAYDPALAAVELAREALGS